MSTRSRPRLHEPPGGERGVALAMALLVLLVVSLLATTLMVSVNVETKVASLGVREGQALNIAEAGVAEAISRIRTGEIPTSSNPRLVAQIFNTAPGNVPVLGTDSVALATRQPTGEWLAYTTANKADSTLTVSYKTNADRTTMYRYDPSRNPAVQTTSGYPIFVVTSTGRQANVARRVITEVIQRPVNVNAKAALAADHGIDFTGDAKICGFNHSIDTPAGTRGRPPCDAWELPTGHNPGAWSTETITSGGSADQDGWPVPNSPEQIGFYSGPWDALGMSQADFFSWIGARLPTEPPNPSGIFYLDNNNTSQDASGDFKYNGGVGDGLLYVDGNLAINGNFVFRGLVYIEGNLDINGTAWILGTVIVKGKSRIKLANGYCTILYSEDAITQSIARHGGQFVTLAWREDRAY